MGSWATPWSLSPLPYLRGLQAVILCLIQLLPDSNMCALYSKLHEPHFPSVTGTPLGPWKNKGVKQKCSTALNTSYLGFRFFPPRDLLLWHQILGFTVPVIRHHHSPPHAGRSEVRRGPGSQSSHTITEGLLVPEPSCSRKKQKSQRQHKARRRYVLYQVPA